MKKIKIIASLDPNRKCISIDADGSAEIKFNTDATQLGPVLQSLAEFRDSTIILTLQHNTRVARGNDENEEDGTETHR